MAKRVFIFLLSSCFALMAVSSAFAAEENEPPREQIIEPEVERQKIDIARIDTEDFDAGPFAGILSVEDFGVNPVAGVRFAYYVNEDIFVEATYAQSKAGRTSYEVLSGAASLINDAQRTLSYYNVSLAYNLLPGEAFITRDVTFNTSLFIIAGIGSTEFAGDDRLTLNIGGGYRMLTTDWMSFRIDVRDHIFNLDLLGIDKTTHNLEVTAGVTFFF